MTVYRHFNGEWNTYGTKGYFEQIIIDMWHENINNVQTKYNDCKAYISAFFAILDEIDDSEIGDERILTLKDA